jgi:hypothetical protein
MESKVRATAEIETHHLSDTDRKDAAPDNLFGVLVILNFIGIHPAVHLNHAEGLTSYRPCWL